MKKRHLKFIENKFFIIASVIFMMIYSFAHNTVAKAQPAVESFFLIIFSIGMIIVMLAPIENLLFQKRPIRYQVIFSGGVIILLIYIIITQLTS